MRRTLKFIALGWLWLSSPFLVLAQECGGRVIVPSSTGLVLGSVSEDDRRCLETLLGGSIQDALDRQVVSPGDTLDFSHPAIHFVYCWQRWADRRIALARSFGPTVHQHTLDVPEVERWNDLRDAWKDLEKAVERFRPRN